MVPNRSLRALYLLLALSPLLIAAAPASSEPKEGAVVEEVTKGWEAHRAGLWPGDLILSWSRGDGTSGPIRSAFDFDHIVHRAEPTRRGDSPGHTRRRKPGVDLATGCMGHENTAHTAGAPPRALRAGPGPVRDRRCRSGRPILAHSPGGGGNAPGSATSLLASGLSGPGARQGGAVDRSGGGSGSSNSEAGGEPSGSGSGHPARL